MRSITEGVYTVQQAARGQQLYKAQCAECHGNVMEGTTGPPLAGDSFLSGWSAQTLSHLVDKIQKTIRSTYLEACPDSNPLSWRRMFSRRAGSRQLWAFDDTTSKIVRFDTKGHLLYAWGALGEYPAGLFNIHGANVDQEGNLYVAEVANGRVQKFRPRPGANPRVPRRQAGVLGLEVAVDSPAGFAFGWFVPNELVSTTPSRFWPPGTWTAYREHVPHLMVGPGTRKAVLYSLGPMPSVFILR